jgi:ATP-binding cassette subfamily B protein
MTTEKLFPNFRALLQCVKKYEPGVIPLVAVTVFASSVRPFPFMFFSKRIINLFVRRAPYSEVILCALLLVGITLLLDLIHEFFNTRLDQKLEKLDYELFKSMSRKTACLDYFMLNIDDTRKKMQDASKAINGKNVSILVKAIKDLMAGVLSIVLVTGIVLSMNWILVLLIVALVFLQSVFSVRLKKMRYDLDRSLWDTDRKMTWFLKYCILGEFAREIRLNQAQNFLIGKHNAYSDEYYRLNNGILELSSRDRQANVVLTAIQDLSLYLLIGWQIVKKNLTVGDFSMTASGAATFKASLFHIIDSISEVRNRCRYFMHYRLYMDLPSVFYGPEEKCPVPDTLEGSVFAFEQVTFRYPGSDRKVLDQVSFQIRYRDIIAIVGENGAGKTTIVNLICRLYDPTEGRILLNGIDIRRFDYDEYTGLFSVVSQDFKMFAMTVRENIRLGAAGQEEARLWHAVKGVGLEKLAGVWPENLDTMLIKEFDPDGVDVSGGESQKIALARAIYRNTPYLIMDEPTSALDPLGEREVFDTILKAAEHKTILFITHRLSSTQFADQILVIEDGRLIESGPHRELMNQNGKYAQLFETQAEYYKEKKS